MGSARISKGFLQSRKQKKLGRFQDVTLDAPIERVDFASLTLPGGGGWRWEAATALNCSFFG